MCQIITLTAHIQVLAAQISQAGIAHVFVEYFGHVNSLDVHVLAADTVYDPGYPKERLIDERVFLNEGGPATIAKLKFIAEQLEALRQPTKTPELDSATA